MLVLDRDELVLNVCCHPPFNPRQSYREADGRGLVAMHGDRGEVIQSLEHIAIERVPGHRGELLGDRGLGAGADLLIAEPGRKENNSIYRYS